MKFRFASLLFAVMCLFVIGQTHAQDPAPTLVPPTPVPRGETGDRDVLISESSVARIQANGVLRAGILFNAPPFAELNIRGEISGFDADLARSMAEAWGVEIEFVQITRDTESAVQLLRLGEVDMLIGAQVHRRELAPILEFSQTYLFGQQAMMVRSGDTEPAELAAFQGRRVGVVVATASETAVSRWMSRTGIDVSLQPYLTLDQAFVGLVSGEVDGIVDSRYRLVQASLLQPEAIRILEETIELEPYAVAFMRQDASMRDLINRTLQYLTANGRMDEIYQVHFPGQAYRAPEVWENVGEDAPIPANYNTELQLPEEFALGRLAARPTLRVAGLLGVTADSGATESERRLDTFHRQLVQELADRWGYAVEFVPNSAQNAVDLVATGQADLAVGVSPDWDQTGIVDFSSAYLRHGLRLMVRSEDRDDLRGFGDLSGEMIITPTNEADTVAYARTIAEERNWRLDFTQQREDDLAFLLLGGNEDVEAEAVFADSFKLVHHVQANTGRVEMTVADNGAPRWYSPARIEGQDFGYEIMALAVPNNDLDFRLLVEVTLQELARDGTLQQLLTTLMLPEEIPQFDIWPGPSTFLGFTLAR